MIMQKILAVAAAGGMMLSLAGAAGATSCFGWWCPSPTPTPTSSITIKNEDVKVIAEVRAVSKTGGNTQTVTGSVTPTMSWWGWTTPSTTVSQSMTTGPAATQALVDKVQVGTALLPSCGCTNPMDVSVTNEDMFVKAESSALSMTGGSTQMVAPMATMTSQAMVTGATSSLSGVNLVSVGYTDFSVN